MTDTDRNSASEEEIKARFDSGRFTKSTISFWLEIINQNKEQ